jgi:thiamine pyrophosphate-dependent acetolactate synthase large subunit-like protein
MAQHVSAFILGRLHDWGVERIYAYPRDGISGLIGAFLRARRRHQVGPRAPRGAGRVHGHRARKLTGDVGSAWPPRAPERSTCSTVYEAKLDHQPVVAVIGPQKTIRWGAHYQQEVDLQVLFKDVASEYCVQISSPAQARHVIDRPIRTWESKPSTPVQECLSRRVTDSLDVVAIGIEDIRAVVVRAVDLAHSRCAVVDSACFERRDVERVDGPSGARAFS